MFYKTFYPSPIGLITLGFSLEEIRQALIHDDLDAFQEFFLKKIEETQHKIEYYHQRLDSLKGWCGLIIEGKEALRHRAFSPHITYLPKRLYFYYERERSLPLLPSSIARRHKQILI